MYCYIWRIGKFLDTYEIGIFAFCFSLALQLQGIKITRSVSHWLSNMPRLESLLIFYCKAILLDSFICLPLDGFFRFSCCIVYWQRISWTKQKSSDSKVLVSLSNHGKGTFLTPYCEFIVVFCSRKWSRVRSAWYLHCVT